MGGFQVQNGQRWVFIGDSITDAGRRDEQPPYGLGYVRMTIEAVTARYPEREITYFNRGIGGNTVADLYDRWQEDALDLKPDWISIMIGINDLHRTLSGEATAVPPERYERLYRDILEQARAQTCARIVLLDPFYISTNTDPSTWEGAVQSLLVEYLAVVHQLVEDFGALHVPTHALFQQQLQYRPATFFCPEPVHPYTAGHAVIAHGLLTALNW